MTTTADHADDAPPPADPRQFVHLANNLIELLHAAERELEHDPPHVHLARRPDRADGEPGERPHSLGHGDALRAAKLDFCTPPVNMFHRFMC